MASLEVLARLTFPAQPTMRLLNRRACPTAYDTEKVDAIAAMLEVGAMGEPFVVEYLGNSQFRSPIAENAQVLNIYFGGETRYQAFPMLPSQPFEFFLDALANLFGARVELLVNNAPEDPNDTPFVY